VAVLHAFSLHRTFGLWLERISKIRLFCAMNRDSFFSKSPREDTQKSQEKCKVRRSGGGREVAREQCEVTKLLRK
jgi:hypothetical protein